MALAAVNVTIGQSLGGGAYSSSVKGGSAPDFATVTTDVATLVADGASPTQAHVTSLNTAYTALAAAINGDVTVVWNGATITSVSQLKAALDRALEGARSGIGALTA